MTCMRNIILGSKYTRGKQDVWKNGRAKNCVEHESETRKFNSSEAKWRAERVTNKILHSFAFAIGFIVNRRSRSVRKKETKSSAQCFDIATICKKCYWHEIYPNRLPHTKGTPTSALSTCNTFKFVGILMCHICRLDAHSPSSRLFHPVFSVCSGCKYEFPFLL